MTHNVLILNKVAATDLGSLNRSAIAASAIDLDNGNVFQLSGSASETGYSEVWWATPASASSASLSNLWMAASPDTTVTTVSGTLKYRGLNQDPRNFYNSGCVVFDAYKPQIDDIISMTADGFTNAISSNTYANAADDGSYKLWWNSVQSASALSYKLVATTYISIGSGAIDNQRVTAYKMVCVWNNGNR